MECVFLNKNKHIYFINSNQIVNAGIKDLFLKYSLNKEIKYEEVNINKDIIKSKIKNLNQIIFEISQNCQLRCAYCVYSDSYKYNRNVSSKLMAFETAKKSIDYILDFVNNRYKKTFYIGFYGGEPILNFDTIKKIVNYSKEKFKNWDLYFTITTNGIGLNEEIIHFFIKNSFNIMVSLDGPEENHDAKRIFPDGTGSFKTVVKNLRKIKKINKDYYLEKVMFSIVYSKDLSIKKMYHFFQSNDLVNQNTIKFGFVNALDTDYYKKNLYDESTFSHQLNKIIKKITDKRQKGQNLSPIENQFFNEFNTLNKRLENRNFSLLVGACFFDNRLYIDADGVFL